jgi:hypothetical protein
MVYEIRNCADGNTTQHDAMIQYLQIICDIY